MLVEDITKSNKVIIIKGNPKKIEAVHDIAEKYYNDISDYIKSYGFEVEFDDGEPYTCPDMDALFWIGHSRGVDREVCIPEEDQWRFLKFGVLDGIIHPDDEQCQQSLDSYDVDYVPPEEHFIFTDEQKEAVDDIINKVQQIGFP